MWDPAGAVAAAEEYARTIASTPEVSRHERVYAAGILIAAFTIGAAAATAEEAAGRLTRLRAILPHSGWPHALGDLDELHRGVIKAADVMGLHGR